MPSTVIAHFNYHAETKTLKIRFVSGAVYDYYEVPETIYQELKTASSKGTYFNQYIKDVYPFERRA
ncbi:KTSC domain-containing protein [Niabella sp. CC-SYL272]|uniref:KTSC domain-containing protein n=1 Tax=Niabella agricola TaxID=2891571 RepID=UPI001F1C01A0|nr:KTSC domain-containing protein [Niabella agricola]MCF3109391.1 KTSC domain-containing protein [Niabella agricola]